ncbi:MAG: helix-turn-helix transcriptional regulator [Candidatus Margulisiibacteriota bacterium]|jgi:transcriptional regulator with XRE-family HTH domain
MCKKHPLGKKIKRHRKKKKLSQRILAKTLCLSRPHLVNIENGKRHPSMETLYRLAEILEVQVGELI